MKRFLITLCLFPFVLSVSFAQTDWKAVLKTDLVTISDDKYQIEEFALITFSNDATLQLKTTASGAMSSISRDRFTSVYSTYSTFLIASILEEAEVKLSTIGIKNIDELSGAADIGIHLEMTKNGIQMIITTEDGPENETITWEEFFGDN